MQNYPRVSPRLAATRALALFSVASLAAGCGSSDTTAATGTSSGESSTSSTTGSGGGSGSSGSSGTGGGEAFCPPGAHPGALDCEADLKDWTAGPKLAHKRDHHVTLVAETPAGAFLYVVAGMTSLTGGEVAGVERAPLDAMGKVGAFADLPPLPLARAHSHQTPLFKGHFYSVGGSKNHVPQAEVWNGTLQ